jgi:release factor glutamine methyltransferase
LNIFVPTGVFHPGLFFSTKLLSAYLTSDSLRGKKVLELGSGSGFLACLSAKVGASVTALDINPLAVRVTQENAERNRLNVLCLESDLFEKLPIQPFDVIVINPPYYPKKPSNMAEHAWYAGENLEYFVRLFASISHYMKMDTEVIFSVSSDVEIERLKLIAAEHGFDFVQIQKKWTIWEWNYLFQLRNSK